MKIGILTYYGVHNHGAVLQANGLKCVLEQMGHDVQFLSFERSYEYLSTELSKKYRIDLNSIPFYFKYMLDKGIGNILYNCKKSNTLREFRNSVFNLDTKYDSFDGDVTIIGSDEVFSLEIGFNPMMYGHGLKSKRIISYAGSFGPTTISEIDEKEKNELITSGLLKFNAISVRDQNSQEIVQKLCGIRTPISCDPVILYGYKKEMTEFIPIKENYIVVYAYDNQMNDFQEVSKIKEYAEKHRLKIYSVGYYHKWCDNNINASPIEVLGWIKNAKLTVTDTFHGSVISILCNTPIVVKLRGNVNKLSHLLNEYGLSNQIMDSFEDIERVAGQTINFMDVNRRLIQKREESMLFLQNALKKE